MFRAAAAAPRRKHQQVVLQLGAALLQHLDNNRCQVFIAPFDVRLPTKSRKNEDIFTVAQPDVCVVCDRSKLDEAGCAGAPDLIAEVLSTGTSKKDLKYKYEVYEESGIQEYWVIHPDGETFLIYTLTEGKYIASRLFTRGDFIKSTCVPGFEVDLEKFFETIH